MSFKSSFTTPVIAAISFCLIGPTSPAAADIIHVPGDFPTIQAAIDAAVNGDEIVVADGVYLGPDNRDLDFNAKLITLRSENGPDNCTINCQFEGRGFFFHSGETNEARVEGFTITNAISFSLGGGMFCIGSSPTVINCIFSTNQAGAGGGMFNDFNSNPQITNCTFILNGANDGGAMFNRDHSSPVLTNCTFSFNSSGKGGGGMINIISSNPILTNCTFIENSSGFAGGAIHNQQDSSLVLINCDFFDNTSQEDAGGVYIGSGTLTARNCIFSGNVALGNWGKAGGGIYATSSANVTLTNCLITDNTADAAGGGMYATGCDVTVTNCTFSDNSADEGAGLRLGNCEATVTNSILWGNTPDQLLGNATVTYSCIQGGYKGEGNIDTDPLFTDPDNNDFHLSAGSPVIDAADNTAVPKGIDSDLDGNPRFVDDPDTKDTGFGDPPIVDMGAYEFQPAFCPADLDNSGDVGVKDLLMLLGAWGPCPPKEDCPADFDNSGDVGVKDLLILLGAWGPCP